MTRELVVRTWCDAHASKGEQVPGDVSYEVTWDGMARTLDLCTECAAFMVAPLLSVLTEVSAAPDAPAAGAAAKAPKAAKAAPSTARRPYARDTEVERGCLFCDYRTTGTPGALSQHVRIAHQIRAYDLVGSPAACPVCGEQRMTPQGLGGHLARSHGLGSVLDALWWADRNGDPHQAASRARAVVADVAARATD